MSKKLTPESVASITGRNPQAVRVSLQNGQCPYGTAYKKADGKHYTYEIYPVKFFEHYGQLPEGVTIDREGNQ